MYIIWYHSRRPTTLVCPIIDTKFDNLIKGWLISTYLHYKGIFSPLQFVTYYSRETQLPLTFHLMVSVSFDDACLNQLFHWGLQTDVLYFKHFLNFLTGILFILSFLFFLKIIIFFSINFHLLRVLQSSAIIILFDTQISLNFVSGRPFKLVPESFYYNLIRFWVFPYLLRQAVPYLPCTIPTPEQPFLKKSLFLLTRNGIPKLRLWW